MRKRKYSALISIIFTLFLLGLSLLSDKFTIVRDTFQTAREVQSANAKEMTSALSSFIVTDIKDIPRFKGKPFSHMNGNIPFFHGEKNLPNEYEYYSELDNLGRCGVAEANVSISIMPTEERKAIGMVKPSGWHTVRYDGIIDKGYLYNRCHLIGFQLAGENANPRNLITGTRYLNVEGMLPYENKIAEYVKKTNNHVRYRVTPVFYGKEVVARGVLLEAESVEDKGKGITFCVFCFNVQPGIIIDYATGESKLEA